MFETSAEAVPNRYIVLFKQHTPEDVCQQHCEWAQSAHAEATAAHTESDGPELTGVGEKFNLETFSGYIGCFDENLKNEIQFREEVELVEPDYIVHASANVTQKPVPSWGIARISSNHVLPSPLPPTVGYTYNEISGAGTTAYVIDTGILISHQDFGGRAKWGTTTVPKSSNTDKSGHGTHVAGIIGGTKYGVAKKCNLIAVKVLGDNGSGTTASVIKGIEWSVADARKKGSIKKSVANMSLGAPKSEILNKAVAAAVTAGLVVVVVAGNENQDACNFSPGSEPLAFTVASTDIKDRKSATSNYGKCVDIWAPGVNITSDWYKPRNESFITLSGSSMAAAHVTGLALTLLALGSASDYSTPDVVTKAIIFLAGKNSKVVPPVPAGTTALIAYNGL